MASIIQAKLVCVCVCGGGGVGVGCWGVGIGTCVFICVKFRQMSPSATLNQIVSI